MPDIQGCVIDPLVVFRVSSLGVHTFRNCLLSYNTGQRKRSNLFPHEDLDHFPMESRNTFTILSCVLTFIGLIGNGLIIVTIIRFKNLRVMVNIFIAVLAFIDLVVVTYLLPLNIYHLQKQGETINYIICKTNGTMLHVLLTSSLQCVMLISITRYVKICHPLSFDCLFSRGNTLLVFLYCLLQNLVFILPLLFRLDGAFVLDKSMHMCIFDRFESRTYSSAFITTCMCVPISVTVICYNKTYSSISESRRRIGLHSHSQLAHGRVSERVKSVRTQFFVLVSYLLLYFPYGLTYLVDKETLPESFHSAAVYLIFMSSAFNSIIYGAFNGNIRSAYFKICRSFRSNPVRVQPYSSENSILVNVVPVQNTTVKNIKLKF